MLQFFEAFFKWSDKGSFYRRRIQLIYQKGGFPVAEHVNLQDHNFNNAINSMSVSVIKQVMGASARKREEMRLIFGHKSLRFRSTFEQ